MKHTITEITDSIVYSTRHRRTENQDQAFELVVRESPGATGGLWMGLCVDGTSDSDGKTAARLAVRTAYAHAAGLLARLPELHDAVDAIEPVNDDISGAFAAAQEAVERIIFPALRELILTAHRVLEAQPLCACTISAAVIYDGVLYTANVGDSPIWLLSTDEFGQLQGQSMYTCHNLAGELARKGTPSQDPRDANRLMAWIGHHSPSGKPFTPDCIAIASQPLYGESILLMGSDGALDMEPDPAALALAGSCQSMQQLCGQLLRRRQEDIRSSDNFTLIAARVFVSE